MSLFDNYKTFLKNKYNYAVECDDNQHVIMDELEKIVASLVKENEKQATCELIIDHKKKEINITNIRRVNNSIEAKGVGKNLMYLISAFAVEIGYTLLFIAVPFDLKNPLGYSAAQKQLIEYYIKIGFTLKNGISGAFLTPPDTLKNIVQTNMATKGGKKTKRKTRKMKKRKF
jgi:hypothetical protein